MMEGLLPVTDPRVLVGLETGDDAGVYQVRDDLALVSTVDMITPVLDDPYLFGAIAAANSLSDIYAMGARPLIALNLCAFPADLHVSAARDILAGAQAKVAEGGGVVVGGHTARNPELLFGLAVTGEVEPARILRRRGLEPGDALVLGKPIGTGVLINARRQNLLPEEDLHAVAEEMAVLNRAAAEVLAAIGPHAVTDITGFALAGHSLAMASGSGCGLRLDLGRVPLYPRAREMAEQGVTTRCTRENRDASSPYVRGLGTLESWQRTLLFDPQTSGGLLVAVPPARAFELVAALREAGYPHAAVIGETFAAPDPYLDVRVP